MNQSSVYSEDDSDVKTGRMQRVKVFLAKHFCDFCSSIPSIALVLCAVLIILLVLSIVPVAIFSIMKTSGSDSKNDIRLQPTDVIRSNNESLSSDEFEGFESSLTRALVPPNISSCSHNGFSCVNNPNIIIGRNQRCDGKPDCPDGSDEIDCHQCLTSFSCPAREGSGELLCLRGDQLCNGVKQCADGADESFCRAECKPDEFKCAGTNKCIPKAFMCDGNDHCPLGDDEIGCEQCNAGAKLCKSSQTCIPIWKLCDGIEDCSDASDEMDCNCDTCSSDEVALCVGSPALKCIRKENVCDGIPQCPNGEDEENCVGTCSFTANTTSPKIKCENGVELPWKYACSGLHPECDSVCDTCNQESAFQCEDKSKCIHRSKVCNGHVDCLDGSDEVSCTKEVEKCDSEAKRCNGFKDCDDGRDEQDCTECKAPGFKCKSENKCLLSHERCDGIEQCQDGSDEENCTCEECSNHPFNMYVCELSGRCYRRGEVCDPHSRCPNPTRRDKMYCATQGRVYF